MAKLNGKLELPWREVILKRLQNRNKKECDCFQGLILSHMKLFESANALKHENIQLSVQNEQLRIGNTHFKSDRSIGNGIPDETTFLEKKLCRVQEELTELHRAKSDHIQLTIDLRNQIQEKDKQLTFTQAKLKERETELTISNEQRDIARQTFQELEATNQMLKDEYQALQIAFNGIQEKCRIVQDENRELVDRWMKEKARDADKLNEENEVFITGRRRSAMKKRVRFSEIVETRRRMQKELDEAARDPVTVETLRLGPVLDNILTFTLPTRLFTKLDGHDGEVLAVKWSPSGKHFATGATDRKVKLWEIVKDSVEPRGVLRGSNAAVTSIDFNSEEDLILGTSNDFASRVWTADDQRLRHTLTGHSGRVLAAKFLGDSSKVISGSHDRTIKMWDLRNLACIRTIFTGSSCNDVVTDRPGTMVVSGHFDKRVRMWDVRRESAASEISFPGKVTSLDMSPDGLSLLTCVRDNTLKLIDLRMNHIIRSYCAEGFWVAFDWTRATFTPDGRFVTAGSQDGTIYIWNTEDNGRVRTLKEHSHSVVACSWQPSGSTLVSCDKNKQICVWTP